MFPMVKLFRLFLIIAFTSQLIASDKSFEPAIDEIKKNSTLRNTIGTIIDLFNTLKIFSNDEQYKQPKLENFTDKEYEILKGKRNNFFSQDCNRMIKGNIYSLDVLKEKIFIVFNNETPIKNYYEGDARNLFASTASSTFKQAIEQHTVDDKNYEYYFIGYKNEGKLATLAANCANEDKDVRNSLKITKLNQVKAITFLSPRLPISPSNHVDITKNTSFGNILNFIKYEDLKKTSYDCAINIPTQIRDEYTTAKEIELAIINFNKTPKKEKNFWINLITPDFQKVLWGVVVGILYFTIPIFIKLEITFP